MNRLLLAKLAALTLSACAGSQPPELLADAGVPEAWSSSPVAIEGQVDGWVRTLDDPHLTALIEEALASNRDLSAARARVEQARALSDGARASLWPAASITIGISDSSDINSGAFGERGAFSIAPSWEADIWGRLEANRDAAGFDLDASNAELAAGRLRLAAAVGEAYVLAVSAQLQTGVTEQTVERLSRTLGFIEVQAERGLRSGQDLALIRADVETARARLLSSEAAQRDALRAIEVLTGRYPALLVETAVQLPEVPAVPDAGVPADILRSRPDIVALESRVAAAARRLDAARADRLPRLSFAGDLTAGGDPAALFNPANVAWQALASLSAPVLDGGARRARVREQRARLAEAMSTYEGVALIAFAEVERALDQSRVLAEREAALDIARTEARQALAFVQYRFEVGDGGLLDVLSVQNRVASLDASVVAVRQQRLDAYIALTLALAGSPLDVDPLD